MAEFMLDPKTGFDFNKCSLDYKPEELDVTLYNVHEYLYQKDGCPHNYTISSHLTVYINTVTTQEEQIWRRDCYTPPDDFIGCKEEMQHGEQVGICVCADSLCNENMGDISTTTSTTSTTTSDGTALYRLP